MHRETAEQSCSSPFPFRSRLPTVVRGAQGPEGTERLDWLTLLAGLRGNNLSELTVPTIGLIGVTHDGSPTGNRGTRHYLSHLDRWSHYVTRPVCYGHLEQNAIKTSILTSEPSSFSSFGSRPPIGPATSHIGSQFPAAIGRDSDRRAPECERRSNRCGDHVARRTRWTSLGHREKGAGNAGGAETTR